MLTNNNGKLVTKAPVGPTLGRAKMRYSPLTKLFGFGLSVMEKMAINFFSASLFQCVTKKKEKKERKKGIFGVGGPIY